MNFKMRIEKYFYWKVSLFGWCMLSIISLTFPVAVLSQPEKDDAKAVIDERFQEVRRANEEAQTEYYREQLRKLREPTPQHTPKTLKQSIRENPAIAIGTLGAVSAALLATLVGLLTIYINHRAIRRLQRDTQFYEALKRFGDKDSPAMRASAAGLLAQMAQTKQGFGRKRPFLGTVLDQLTSGLLIEENSVVLISIRDALKRITVLIPHEAAKKLRDANLILQQNVALVLADFFVLGGSYNPNTIDDKLWDQMEALLGYERDAIKFITVQQSFINYFKAATQAFSNVGAERKQEYLISTQKALIILGARFRGNIEVLSYFFDRLYPESFMSNFRVAWELYGVLSTGGFLSRIMVMIRGMQGRVAGKLLIDVLHDTLPNLNNCFMPKASLRYTKSRIVLLKAAHLNGADLSRGTFNGVRFDGSDLRQTNFSYSRLQDNASLWDVKLQGANLSNSMLSGVCLGKAEIDDKTNFDGTNWWKACFFLHNDANNYLDIKELFDEINNPSSRDVNKSGRLQKDSEESLELDVRLLNILCERYVDSIPNHIDDLHPSVKKYIESNGKKQLNEN
ncbi:MAG TPA: pentapeptide repeat-containing protein [Pyrinomonadaceae bacterium]|nr:pentapeptide repeat-containing protein [Pyrinomonadaceae bacterium]